MILAEHTTRTFGGTWRGLSGLACCPAHEDRSPSLSLGVGVDGRLLVHCHAGCSYEVVMDAPGRDAAQSLARRAQALGWQVMMLPAPEGFDWNDVLLGKAVAA